MYSLYLTKYHSSFKWIFPNYLNISIQIYLKTLVTFPSIITTTFLTPYLYISSILTFILLHLTSFLLSIDFHFFYSSSFVSTFLQNNFFSSSRFYPCPFPPSCYNSNLFLAVYTSLPLLINNPFSFFHCLFPSFSLYWPRVLLFFLYFFSLISLFRFSRFFRFLPLAFICFISLSLTHSFHLLSPPFHLHYSSIYSFASSFPLSISFLPSSSAFFFLPLFHWFLSFFCFLPLFFPLYLPPSLLLFTSSLPLLLCFSFHLRYPSLYPTTSPSLLSVSFSLPHLSICFPSPFICYPVFSSTIPDIFISLFLYFFLLEIFVFYSYIFILRIS